MKSIKLSLLLALAVAVGSFYAVSAKAADDAVIAPPVVVSPSVVAENIPSDLKVEKRLDKIKTRGAKLVADRVASLNKLKSKIASSKLTDTQKNDLTTIIDTNISGLNSLADQIKAGTDASSTRALVQKIFTDFRIYAVVVPKIHALIALDRETNHVANVNERFARVQARIDAAKAKGKDVSARQTALDAAKTKLAEAENQINALIAKANSLKPADYPSISKTVINDIRAGIKAVNTIFKQINQDLKTAK
jgi:hypothetical protein